ncbi:hypothetical protein F4777DRAFT_563010 [Nemania sp. FL0916]|nr:hypothetical protein F4777DRAFT_563010 [Nemania sp. FL0916]
MIPVTMPFFGGVRMAQAKYHRLRLSEERCLVGDDKDFSEEQEPHLPSRSLRWHQIALYTALAVLTILLVTISTLYIELLHRTSPRPQLTCGKTVAEAKEAGCSFDRLTKSWLPAECPRNYEEEYVQFPLTLNMTNLTSWHYWDDADHGKEITDEEMALFAETRPLHNMSWLSTARMHLAHCAFTLMRRADAEEAGKRMDATAEHLPHMKHCLQMLLDAAMKAPGIDRRTASGEVGFGAC